MNLFSMTLKLSEEQRQKLEELAKEKYRGTNKSQAIRWMIEDVYLKWKEVEAFKCLEDRTKEGGIK